MSSARNPPVLEADLMAYVDGRLPEGQRADVEAWLSARPDEAERISAYQRQNQELSALFDSVLVEPVPKQLLSVQRRAFFARPRWVAYAATAGFTLVGLGLGVLAGWQLHALQMPLASPGMSIARNAAVAHATYTPEVRHAVEVGADQEGHLVAWLSKRLGTRLRAPRLDTSGFNLVGGRLLPGEPKPSGGPSPVAQFMYQTQSGKRLTLYVRTEAVNDQTAFHYALEGGVGVFYWIDRSVGYALSSADLNREELLAMANQVYKQLNP